ncbi:MAG: PEGA domain-containing protein [Gammaproteobacteria bacterium]|nr:PEGA domain-containing protein [Gammaproteobacteria bacterium]
MPTDSATEGIQPTRFKPTEQTSRLRFRLPTWWQWVLIVIGIVVVVIAWFLLTANAVSFTTNAEDSTIEISGGLVIPSGPRYLIRPGDIQVRASAKGYEPLRTSVLVESQSDQTIEIELTPLPGKVTITGSPAGAQINRSDENLGNAPMTIDVPAGEIRLAVQADRHQPGEITAEIIGREVEQTLSYQLRPNWADVTIPTTPPGANVSIDDVETEFVTPGPFPVMAGERKISIKSPGYERWTDILYVEPEQEIVLPDVLLTLIGGTLYLKSTPTSASVNINGEFVGTTPLDIDLRPNRNHRVETSLFGYHTSIRNVNLSTGESRRLDLQLKEVTGKLAVTTQPEDAEIWVDGELAGISNTTLTLHAKDHDIELRKDGYAGYSTQITVQTEFQQEIKVRLLTNEEARLAALEQARETSEGQAMVLLKPKQIRMGASRRQPGRRANEVFRSVELERMFYVSKDEITNAQFRRFASGHDSGEFESTTLNKDEQPVVNVSWHEAAQYCNWLSTKEGFEPFYVLRPGDPPKYNPNSLGYRLPSEAEWAWVARTTSTTDELLLFPWGDSLPPPNYHGNYADQAAQHIIGRTIFNYNDNHTVAAPVGTFDPNYHGLNDIGGNVAEWVHNFYVVPSVNETIENLGPETGEYHVIRGASWMHGTITDLRLSFRDYGADGRRDVGFRIARFAE